jgi:BatD DUF11 like domain
MAPTSMTSATLHRFLWFVPLHRGGLLAFFLVCVCLSRTAFALDARLILDREAIEAGETVGMQVVVDGTQRSATPTIPQIPGVRMRYLGPSSQMENINGQTSVRVSHRYQLALDTTNDVVIPPLQVRVANQTLTTQPGRIRVLPREAHEEPVWLKLVMDRDEVVVGDTFPVELHLYFQAIRSPSAPRFDLDGFVVGRSTQPTQATTQRGNQQWSVVIWKFAVTATKPGDLVVGPAEMDLVLLLPAQDPRRRDSLVDDFFGLPREARQVTLKSGSHRLKAIAPPSLGRPANYAGAVGRFRMNASVSPSQLTVGDPATVRLTIQGQGGIERLELEPWPEDPAFRVYPGTNGFVPADELGLSGVKTMEFVLVPERPGRLTVPVPPLVFFDPEARRYEQAKVEDLSLDVRPAVVRPAPGSGTNVAGGISGSGTNAAALAGSVPLLEWRMTRGSGPVVPQGWSASPWVGVAVGIPWVAWVGLSIAGAFRRRRLARPAGPARDGWLRECHAISATLGSGPTTDLTPLSRSVRCWIGWWLDRSPEGITAEVVDRDLRPGGLDPAVCDQLVAWFSRYELLRFAKGAGGDLEGFSRETSELLKVLREQEGPR